MRLRRPPAGHSSQSRFPVRRARLLMCLLAYVAIASAQPPLLPANAPLATNQGFCPNGAFPQTRWLDGKPNGIRAWGSFCKDGDRTTGAAITSTFPAPAYLRIYLAGYPSSAGVTLKIENLSNGAKLPITLIDQPREIWLMYDFPLPRAWRGKPVRLIAEDHNTGPGGWLAFSEPLQGSAAIGGFNEALPLLLRTLSHFVLTMLPAFALCAVAIYRGVRDVVLAGLLTLAATGAFGYLAFWIWFVWPRAGHVFAFLLPIAGIVCLIWSWRKLDAVGHGILSALLIPWLLTGASALLVISIGFLYGGIRRPLTTASLRFSHRLPPDNAIPYLFAEHTRVANIPKPLLGDWHSSDRPPLQTGIVLSQIRYNPNPRELGYAVLCVILQSLWILALWLLLAAFGVTARAATLTLLVCLFSGFVFLNSFYVWPKLLAAAYMMGFFAVFLTRRFAVALRSNLLLPVTGGVLLAFGMLSHGSSAFALAGFALTILPNLRRLPLRALAIATLTAFLIYLPWILYQKIYDPPGDRLLKYHLGGAGEHLDPRPFTEVLASSYAKLSARQILNNKVENLTTDVGYLREYWSDAMQLPATAADMRRLMFFYFVPNLGFLVLGPFALLIGLKKQWRSAEWKTAAILWLFVGLTIISWCLLMFGPATTVIHQGTYVMVLLGYAGSILALWTVSSWLAWLIGSLQIALNFVVYVLCIRQPLPNQLPPEGVVRYATLSLALLAIAGIAVLLNASSSRFASDAPRKPPSTD